MLYEDQIVTMDYFGEWSDTLGEAHGRGFMFGKSVNGYFMTRIGYYTKGSPLDGKVFKLEVIDQNHGNELKFYIGTE